MIIPVILSGGAGTRLWPVSRQLHPKPFIQLPDGQTLLHKTFLRASSIKNVPEIITITNKEYYLKCKPEYESINLDDYPPRLSFLLEPFPRNTAPAIALAALQIFHQYGPDAIALILPADHLITDVTAFVNACETAFTLAKTDKIVTFGIKPTAPETGFGYIECGEPYSIANTYQVHQFIEKPCLEVAENYLQSNRYLWNSGMFCFNVKHLLHELAQYTPELLKQIKTCWELSTQHTHHLAAIDIHEACFNEIQAISFDYALMEKTRSAAVVACDFDWQDIGSWKAYKNLHQPDDNGNAILGDAILIDSQNNFIHSAHRMIASVGIHNLCIIDTPDALLISHRDSSQDVGKIVQELKKTDHQSYMNHRTVARPWGSYTVLEESAMFKIKRIVIKPHASLSLQMHNHRSEHWVVVQGIADIINGDKHYQLQQNESTFVPIKTLHRIANNSKTDLIIIEVQSGDYLGEDDIIRYEDNYGRITANA